MNLEIVNHLKNILKNNSNSDFDVEDRTGKNERIESIHGHVNGKINYGIFNIVRKQDDYSLLVIFTDRAPNVDETDKSDKYMHIHGKKPLGELVKVKIEDKRKFLTLKDLKYSPRKVKTKDRNPERKIIFEAGYGSLDVKIFIEEECFLNDLFFYAENRFRADELEKTKILGTPSTNPNKKNSPGEDSKPIAKTTLISLGKQRIGQDKFREKLIDKWGECSVTGLDKKEILRASHIKPWSESNDEEKLDVFNGLLLNPSLDILFDKGLISFKNNGKIIISSQLEEKERKILNVRDDMCLKKVHPKNKLYLKYHRENIYKK